MAFLSRSNHGLGSEDSNQDIVTSYNDLIVGGGGGGGEVTEKKLQNNNKNANNII